MLHGVAARALALALICSGSHSFALVCMRRRAVLDPDVGCGGGVAPDTSLKYVMGEEGDPDGVFCTVRAG